MASTERALLHEVHTTDEPLSMAETNTLSDAARLLVKYPSLGVAFARILPRSLKAGTTMTTTTDDVFVNLITLITNAQAAADNGWLDDALNKTGRAMHLVIDKLADHSDSEILDRVTAFHLEVQRQHWDSATPLIDLPTLRTMYLAAVGALHLARNR